MKEINASEFKAKCLAIIDEVAQTGQTVTILKRGKPVARLVPSVPQRGDYPQETLLGSVTILGDVIDPVFEPDVWEATQGKGAEGASSA